MGIDGAPSHLYGCHIQFFPRHANGLRADTPGTNHQAVGAGGSAHAAAHQGQRQQRSAASALLGSHRGRIGRAKAEQFRMRRRQRAKEVDASVARDGRTAQLAKSRRPSLDEEPAVGGDGEWNSVALTEAVLTEAMLTDGTGTETTLDPTASAARSAP